MRLGGPVFVQTQDPGEWAAAVKAAGYRAAYCPVGDDAAEGTIRAFAQAAEAADIVIAEVGAWSNPLSPDPDKARAALEKCRHKLALADAIGARCCVNIAGSCREGQDGAAWHGPHADDLTSETFDRLVATIRQIIDAVRPTRADYTIETMPWMTPDSADEYLRLIRAVDRPRFAAHLDPVNLVNSPRRYFDTAALLRDCFAKLGPYIRSCHAKDIVLRDTLTVHLDETVPGRGWLDYRAFLQGLSQLPPDTPLMLEHMKTAEEYAEAAAYIRSVARETGVSS